MQSSSNVASPAGLDAIDLKARRPRTARGWGRLPVWLRRVMLLGLLIGAWQAYVSLEQPNPLTFAGPRAVADAFYEGWRSGNLLDSTLATLKILGLGMLFGTLAAAVLTTLATWTTVGDDLLSLLTSMLNPLPSIAVLPLILLWFGLTERSLVIVIALAVTWPIAINISMGFKTVNQTIVAVGRNIGLSGRRLVTDVLAPAALPHAIAGIKTAWAFGWRTVIAAELVFGVAGASGGLGTFINNSKLYLLIPEVFAGLVTIALIGIAFDFLFTVLERRTVVRWGMKTS